MAYNENLADRIREVLGQRKGITEMKMFGGLSFMLNGNMCCGIVKDDLVARVDPDSYDHALAKSHTRPMDFTGRPIKGMVYVGAESYGTDEDLKHWVEQGLSFAMSLPPKTSKVIRKDRGQR